MYKEQTVVDEIERRELLWFAHTKEWRTNGLRKLWSTIKTEEDSIKKKKIQKHD